MCVTQLVRPTVIHSLAPGQRSHKIGALCCSWVKTSTTHSRCTDKTVCCFRSVFLLAKMCAKYSTFHQSGCVRLGWGNHGRPSDVPELFRVSADICFISQTRPGQTSPVCNCSGTTTLQMPAAPAQCITRNCSHSFRAPKSFYGAHKTQYQGFLCSPNCSAALFRAATAAHTSSRCGASPSTKNPDLERENRSARFVGCPVLLRMYITRIHPIQLLAHAE